MRQINSVDRLILLNCSVSTPKNVETFLTYYKVNTVYLSQCDTSLCTEIKETAKLYGTAVEEFENSSVITSGDIGISCYSSKYNSAPSVFVDYGDNRVLFYSSNTVPLSKLESNSDTLLVINGTATPTEIYQTLARIKYIGLALDQTKFSQSGYRLDLDGYLNITDTSNSSFTKITIKNGKTRIKLYES